MDFLTDASTTTYVAVTALLGAAALLVLRSTQLSTFLKRKHYQYNVTLALYMLTPTERFVFNSILFLTLTLLTFGVCLYLPEHVSIISRRVYYYCFGQGETSAAAVLAKTATRAVTQATQEAAQVVRDMGRRSSGDMAREMLRGKM